MIIRQEQIEALEAAGKARFETELLPHLKKELSALGGRRRRRPPQPPHLRGRPARRQVRLPGPRPGPHVHRVHGPAGHEFDQDPLLYWVQDILRDKEGLDEMEQARRLHLHVSTYLGLVYGQPASTSPKASSTLRRPR